MIENVEKISDEKVDGVRVIEYQKIIIDEKTGKETVKRCVARFDDKGRVSKEHYDIRILLKDSNKNRIYGRRKLDFKNSLIDALPLCSDGTVDIVDDRYTAESDGGRLILRIGKSKKVFYPVIRMIEGRRGTGKTLGDFSKARENKSDADVAIARKRFIEAVNNENASRSENMADGNMTIREYIDSGKYVDDRENIEVKKGIKKVTKDTLKKIKSGFGPFLDRKLNQVSKDWINEFDAHWNRTYTNTTNGKTYNGIKSETKRRYYTLLNAMFSVAAKKQYISHNKIDGFTSRFPRSPKGPVKTYDTPLSQVVDFIFDDETPGRLAGKLIMASVTLMGCRPGEIRKNFIENFDFEKRRIWIPSEICKTGDAGARFISNENDVYWEYMQEHVSTVVRNTSGHMFPSLVKEWQPVSENVYSKSVWPAMKKRFGYEDTDKLYSFRATVGTKIRKSHGLDVAAAALGDSLETANTFYNDIKEEELKEAFSGVDKDDTREVDQEKEQPSDANLYINASQLEIPEAALKFWKMFKGSRLQDDDKMLKADYEQFVALIQKQVNAGKIDDDEVTMWLEFQ